MQHSLTMQHSPTMKQSKGARTLGRIGAVLASAASIVALAGPASAAAVTTAYDHSHEQFSIYLTGDELRDGGDHYGRGFARLDLDPRNERVCYVLTWSRLDGDVTAFHIHAGPRHSDGPVWINFFNNERFDGDRGTVANCVHADRGKIRDIIDEPSDYYLTVHTTAHEMGAIRGQLD